MFDKLFFLLRDDKVESPLRNNHYTGIITQQHVIITTTNRRADVLVSDVRDHLPSSAKASEVQVQYRQMVSDHLGHEDDWLMLQ